MRVAGGPNFRHLTINGTSAILQDVNVRQALAMAIDRAAIARAMLGPLGIEPATLDNHIFMANQKGTRTTPATSASTTRNARSSCSTRRAGSSTATVRKKDGSTLEINFVIPAAVATSKQESELIQNMLGQVGVTVPINTVPSPDFFENYITPGQFDFTVFSWMGTPFPISSFEVALCEADEERRRGAGHPAELRAGRVGRDRRAVHQATQELDRKKAIELANQIDALIWQVVHSLTLYQRPELWVKKSLANFGAFGFAEIVYEDIGWAKR